MQMFSPTLRFPQNTCNHYHEQQTSDWRQRVDREEVSASQSKSQSPNHEFNQEFMDWRHTIEGQLKIKSWTDEMNMVEKYRDKKYDPYCFEALYFLHEKLDYDQAFTLFYSTFKLANDKFCYTELVKMGNQGLGISQATVESAWNFFMVNPVAWSASSAKHVSNITPALAKQLYELHQCDGKLIQFAKMMRSVFGWSDIRDQENELAKNELINYWSGILIAAFDHDPDAWHLFLDCDNYRPVIAANDKFKSCFKKVADEREDALCAYEYAICVFNEENKNPPPNSDYYTYLMFAADRDNKWAQKAVIDIRNNNPLINIPDKLFNKCQSVL
jgi:hypothetical protein